MARLDVHAHVRGSVVPYVLEILGEPWTLEVLRLLLAGPQRFDALVETLGVPRSTLVARLRHLEARACVRRRPYQTSPPRDEYLLTERGRALQAVLLSLARWDRRHGHGTAPELTHTCGRPLELELVCEGCGGPIRLRDVTLGEPAPPADLTLGPLPSRRTRGRGPADATSASGPITASSLLGDRWMPRILALAYYGVSRYGELEAFLGIAPNILARRLAVLVEQQLLERRRYQTSPERFEYRLTRKGRDLFPTVVAMTEWGERHLRPGLVTSTLIHRTCGAPLVIETRCAGCGERTTPP